ncbi:TPA: CHAP domain-containing protein [Staphylococcus aureus]|nr:CHAP domain-containing protein [Staphylococcus aureus]
MKILALLSSKRVRKIAIALVGAILIPIFAFIVLLASFSAQKSDDDGYETNGSCSVEGGELSDKGKEVFEKNAKGGALEGKTDEVVKTAKKHGIPPNLFIAIIAGESQWGRGANATDQKNPLSVMGAGTIHSDHARFPNIQKGLDAGAKNLKDLYISKGLTTPEKIGPKYAPTVGASNDPDGQNNNWIPTVKKIMKSLGGEKSKTSCSKGGSDGKGFNLKGSKFPDIKGAKEYSFNPTYPWGQCTWYVHQRRHQIGKDVPTTLGDGGDWADNAKSQGFKTGKTPKEGACASLGRGVLGADGIYGHIMFVEKVKKDGGITVSEANVKGKGVISTRDFSKEEASKINYIYDK